MLPSTATTPDSPLRTGTKAGSILGSFHSTAKGSLDEAKPTHGVAYMITRRTTATEHSLFYVPPVEPRYASTRRVEHASAQMHEIVGCSW